MPSFVNPLHPIDPTTTDLLEKIAENDAAERERVSAVSALLRASGRERDLRRAAARRALAASQGEEPAQLEQVRDLKIERLRLFSDKIAGWERAWLWKDLEPELQEAPEPQDHNFWWAKTDWSPDNWYKWGEHSITGTYRRDGVVEFRGWVNRKDGDLFSGRFGATALFELQAARRPASPSGLLRSAPSVRVGGAVSGHTDGFDAWQFWEGDYWSKCWMVRRQRIFQHGLGGPIPLGERSEVQTLFERENTNGNSTAPLPGLIPMPSLDFRVQGVADSVWVLLEVRFDYQLEGDASSISFLEHPVEIAFSQWAPTVI